MKKKFCKWVVLTTLLGSLVLPVHASAATMYSYSNLKDSKTITSVTKQMKKSGLKSQDISLFKKNVKYYNKSIKNQSLVKKGFKKVKNMPTYSDALVSTWEKSNPTFLGYNCRITAYTLMKGNITSKDKHPRDLDFLVMDESALKSAPSKQLTKKERKEFEALYASVPTDASSSQSVQYKTFKKAWKKAGITFSKKTKATLISVVLHDVFSETQGELYVGHTGVLVPNGKSGYLFVEKVSFQEPYQVIRFKNKKELKKYLQNRYKDYVLGGAEPMILENYKQL